MRKTSNFVRIGAATLRTKVGDFAHNEQAICGAISEAVNESDLDILLFPELAVSGYGLLDFFQSPDIHQCIIDTLKRIEEHLVFLARSKDTKLICAIGIPVMLEGGQLYNGIAILDSSDGLLGITCKKNLAMNGIHYEGRWFRSWPDNVVIHDDFYGCYVGDLIYDIGGVKLGLEICEDAWSPNRPAGQLYDRRVDIILNPSASHYTVGKYDIREQFVKEGSRAFGAVYVYANLTGCEEGQAIYDAGNFIASNGEIVARGERFSFKDYSIVTAVVDLIQNRVTRNVTSQTIPPHNDENCVKIPFEFSGSTIKPKSDDLQSYWADISKYVEFVRSMAKDAGDPIAKFCKGDVEAFYAGALGTFDWQSVRGLKGSTISLSGGADSLLCTGLETMAHVLAAKELGYEKYLERLIDSGQDIPILKSITENTVYSELPYAKDQQQFVLKNIMPHVLTTVYQGTKNSSDDTRNAAKLIAQGFGSVHIDWDVDDLVNSYTDKVETALDIKVTPQQHDIAMQNIQARSRNPGAWYVANVLGQMLICTSNLTESWVGYVSADGDQAGLRCPISGYYKTRILRINKMLEIGLPHSDGLIKTPEIEQANNLKPSAELREEKQTDEDDLMPFEVLEDIITLNIKERRMPSGILEKMMLSDFGMKYGLEVLADNIEKAFTLNARSQVKRHKAAAGFHIEVESVDPKTYSRAPLMSHWVDHQIKLMRQMQKSLSA